MNLAKIVYDSYPSSDLLSVDPADAHTLRTLCAALDKARYGCGDGLFQFIVRELADASGDDPQEALRLLQNAKRDIEAVIDGIQRESRTERGELPINDDRVIERIRDAVDEMDFDDLARTYNELTNNEPITGDDIISRDG